MSLTNWTILINSSAKLLRILSIIYSFQLYRGYLSNLGLYLNSLNRITTNTMVSYDITLKENFKLFISGPSRCGKTFFVADLLQNIETFAREPPQAVVYIYSVWQIKFNKMKTLVTYFIEDNENIYDTIREIASNQPTIVVFDDLINSKTIQTIAKLYTVDGRHMNLSMVFLTQRMF